MLVVILLYDQLIFRPLVVWVDGLRFEQDATGYVPRSWALNIMRRSRLVALVTRLFYGAVRWTTEGREGEHASLLLTPQHVVFLTNGADLIVAKRGTPAFTVERRYEVAEASTFAMPVLLGSNILVRDATGLMLLTAGN